MLIRPILLNNTSRYYHIPEVISKYKIPTLSMFNEGITKGLYQEGRYKSKFSSKQYAPKAFQSLIEIANKLKSNILISYSDLKTGITGNERMIKIDDILDIANYHGGYYPGEVIEMNHTYRDFNKSESIVLEKQDAEYLIFLRKK